MKLALTRTGKPKPIAVFLAAVYVAAITTVLLDVFLWRP